MNADQIEGQPSHAEIPGSPCRIPPYTILVVDDCAGIRELVKKCLNLAGHEVICAATGVEATKLLTEQQFDLLITDIFMPDMDGLELISLVAKEHPSLSVLTISGASGCFADKIYLQTARLLGAHAVLVKPFGQPELFEAIGRACGG